ncbi:uncharacterized protein OCT59_000984 [Rhizophagus irregularis]|uniref:uncharacterized protein n=1 Tax=Rhizophagus irregularis TaxID=588596 RepID=UPI000CBDC4D9|nr:hypothetical protein OCT59_000984 [Rhizophagus irregularis]GBC28629.1 hypothetical protein RIR_jg10686.t1 [Rhizophagus irregularis DAOM 181602=DAOM 197198]
MSTCLQVGYHWKVITVQAGYLTLIAVLRFWESDRSGAPSPPASILGLITCRFRSITLKLQFKWFGDIWEALLNKSHYFPFRYWIWLPKWLL